MTAFVYDPRYHTFNSWASLMVEMYAAQNIQIPMPDTDWKSWSVGLVAIDAFVNEGIPSPYAFDDWQDWAQALVGIVNPRP